MAELSRFLARKKVRELCGLARKLMGKGAVAKALDVAERAAAMARADLAADSPEFVLALNASAAANMYLERYDVADDILCELLDTAARGKEKDTLEYAAALNNLAIARMRLHRLAEAVLPLEQAIAIKRRLHGVLSPSYLGNLEDLTQLLEQLEQHATALPHYVEMRDIVGRMVGETDPEYEKAQHNLALALEHAGREEEAKILRDRTPNNLHFNHHSIGDDPEVREVMRLYQTGAYNAAGELQHRVVARLPKLPIPGMFHAALGNPLDPFLGSIGELDKIGIAADKRGDFKDAVLQFETVRRMIRISLDERHPRYAAALNNLADVLRKSGEFEEAKRVFREALDVLEGVAEDEELKSVIAANVARLYWDIAEKVAPHHGGMSALRTEDFKDKPQDYTVSLRLRFPVPVEGESTVFNTLRWVDARAKFYESKGTFESAEFLYKLAVELCVFIYGRDHPNLLGPLENLAAFELARGEFADAERHLSDAVAIAEEQGQGARMRIVGLLQRQTRLLSTVGHHAEAERTMLQAIALLRRDGDCSSSQIASLEEDLAVLRLRMGRTDLAAETLRRILAEVPGNGELADQDPVRLQQLATFSTVLRDHARAAKFYEAALAGQKDRTGEWTANFALTLSNYGSMLRMAGRWVEAEPRFRRATEIRRVQLGSSHPDVLESQIRLALVLAALDRPEEALAAIEEALDVSARLTGRLSAMSSELARMEIVRRQLLHLDIGLSIVRACFTDRPDAIRKAYDFVLRRKSIGVLALVVQRNALLSGRYPHLNEKMSELDALRIEIVRAAMGRGGPPNAFVAQPLLEEAQQHRSKLEAELSREIREMTLEEPLARVNVEAVAAALPSESVLVEFVAFKPYNFKGVLANDDPEFLPDRYIGFLLHAGQPDRIAFLDFGEAGSVDSLIGAVMAALPRAATGGRDLGVRNGVDPEKRAQTELALLAARVFEPIVGRLGGRTRILIAPDGDVSLLAFDVLPLKDGRLVIDEYDISYVGTGRDAIRFSSVSSDALGAPFVLAAPDFDLEAPFVNAKAAGSTEVSDSVRAARLFGRFTPLPATRIEGEAIARRLTGAQLLTDQNALKGALRAVKHPSIFHLATHAFALPRERAGDQVDDGGPRDPMLSCGLALAGANAWLAGKELPELAGNGLLMAEDVTTLDLLETDLVVLAACETAVGEVLRGEGVFGLRRAFAVAGARGIVMSLWKVPDIETKDLMLHLYDALLAGMPKSAALRSAKLALRRRKPNPYYWGAFIFEGDWHPLRLGK